MLKPSVPAISVQDASFSWSDASSKAVLRKIDFDIPRGKLVAIVGQVRSALPYCFVRFKYGFKVGTGKSSLTSALLGQMYKLSGSVQTVDSVAYIAQQAWIQNATVKQNVLFGKTMEAGRYSEIVGFARVACCISS